MKAILCLLAALLLSVVAAEAQVNVLITQVSAQQIVCPIVVSVGEVWIDHYPVKMQNVGNGVAMAVVLSRTRTVASPLGGMTTISENVWTVARLVPGEWVEVRFHKNWPGSFSASAGACVDR